MQSILSMVVLLPFVALLVWFVGWLQDIFGVGYGEIIALGIVAVFILFIIGFTVMKILRLARIEKEMLERAKEETKGR